tara:strand:+ start:68 stop:682 length:615 start_codon:yes stop_codon:yes gene_type:complete
MSVAENKSMKVVPIKFALAKQIYSWYHRTNKPPQGHKRTYVAMRGDDWCKCMPADLVDCQDDWEDDSNDDVIIRHDDCGDAWVFTRGEIIGICSIGRPVARWNDKRVHEITRICFTDFQPTSNAERKYFSKLVREAMKDFVKHYDVSKFVTYIHDYQSGRYLEYAGLTKDQHKKYTANNKGWSTRPNRARSDLSGKFRFTKEAA